MLIVVVLSERILRAFSIQSAFGHGFCKSLPMEGFANSGNTRQPYHFCISPGKELMQPIRRWPSKLLNILRVMVRALGLEPRTNALKGRCHCFLVLP
jgi:hypothetical protein